jgi:hypothetical protein
VAVSFSLCRPVFRQSSDDAMRGAGGNPADLLFKETDGKCIADREVPFSGKKVFSLSPNEITNCAKS